MNQIPHIKEFSKNSSSYECYNFIQKKVALKLTSKITRDFKNILDLGCGDGLVYKNITCNFEKFVGIDLSESMLKLHPKDEKVSLFCEDFDKFENFKEFDLVLSSSSLQWSSDIYSLIKKIESQSENFALAIFTRGTFKNLREFLKLKSFLPNKQDLQNIFSKNVSCETLTYKIKFDSNLSMLRYIKKSGVSGGKRELSIKEVKNFLRHFDKNYLEFEILLATKLPKTF